MYTKVLLPRNEININWSLYAAHCTKFEATSSLVQHGKYRSLESRLSTLYNINRYKPQFPKCHLEDILYATLLQNKSSSPIIHILWSIPCYSLGSHHFHNYIVQAKQVLWKTEFPRIAHEGCYCTYLYNYITITHIYIIHMYIYIYI